MACLGVYGLAAQTAEQRTKEIGIRRAMEASAGNIIRILSRIYLNLVTVATLIACPLGYSFMNKWLQGFPFHTSIGVTVFVYSVVIALVIVISSVSYHSVNAALTSPASTLKYE
jgi:ABC-type antimicrobial peptide transport system permease subunit